MNEDKKTHICFTCGRKFQMQEHVYDGTWIRNYQIEVCKSCYNMNWDGWTTDRSTRIIKHLQEKGLPIPEFNEKGWLPRGD